MKNIQTCNSCGTENPFYVSICKKCNFIMRNKIVNIDLWSIIGKLIENPANAFRIIIQSEHKNFVLSTILFASVKFSIDATFIAMLFFKGNYGDFRIFSNLIFAILILLVALFGFSFLIKLITQDTQAKTRLKDNLAILTYSLIPHSLALWTIFPIEIAVFGGSVFSTNPSPFLLKPTLAYVLAGFEILIFMWSIFLAVVSMYIQSGSKLFGICTGILFSIILLGCLYVLSVL